MFQEVFDEIASGSTLVVRSKSVTLVSLAWDLVRRAWGAAWLLERCQILRWDASKVDKQIRWILHGMVRMPRIEVSFSLQ